MLQLLFLPFDIFVAKRACQNLTQRLQSSYLFRIHVLWSTNKTKTSQVLLNFGVVEVSRWSKERLHYLEVGDAGEKKKKSQLQTEARLIAIATGSCGCSSYRATPSPLTIDISPEHILFLFLLHAHTTLN